MCESIEKQQEDAVRKRQQRKAGKSTYSKNRGSHQIDRNLIRKSRHSNPAMRGHQQEDTQGYQPLKQSPVNRFTKRVREELSQRQNQLYSSPASLITPTTNLGSGESVREQFTATQYTTPLEQQHFLQLIRTMIQQQIPQFVIPFLQSQNNPFPQNMQ